MIKRILFILAASAAAPLSAQEESDPFGGDPRLLKKHTIKAVGVPLKDLMESLSSETGVQLDAGPKVAADNLVLFAYDRPLVDSLRKIASFFNFYWTRTGEGPNRSYTISQSLKQQKQEEAEIDSDYIRAAVQIQKEVRLILKHSDKSKEQLNTLLDDLDTRIKAESDGAALADLTSERRIVLSLLRSQNPILAARLLRDFDRDGIIRLLKTPRIEFAWPHARGMEPMLPDVREHIYRLVAAQSKAEVPAYNFAKLTLDGSQALEPRLSGNMTAGANPLSGVRSTTTGFTLPMDSNYRAHDQGLPIEPAGWKEIPQLQSRVHAAATSDPGAELGVRRALPPPPAAVIIAAIQTNRPFDIIADAFYGSRPIEITVDAPLGQALTSLCRITGHYWTYGDGFVQVRDRRYAAFRRGEPSVFKLRKWASLPREKLYALDILGEIADQNMPQFETTTRWLDDVAATDPHISIWGSRGCLVFWNRLTPARRRAALAPSGVAYRSLNRSQRELFEQASLGRIDLQTARASGSDKTWSPGELRNAIFRVEKVEQTVWGYPTSTGPEVFTGTRESVFARLSPKNPSLTIDQIRPARSAYYRFHFASPGFKTTGEVSIPLIWLTNDGRAPVGPR